MPGFVIEGSVLKRLQARGALLPSSTFAKRPPDVGRLRGVWLKDDGRSPVGNSFDIDVPGPGSVEVFHPSGEIKHSDVARDARFDAEAPVDARFLRLEQNGASVTLLAELVRELDPLPAVTPDRCGPKTASFVYPVFSERFAIKQPFLDAVDALQKWIIKVPPFNTEAMLQSFALDAYFWPTTDPYGHFHTKDVPYDCINRPPAEPFLGHNPTARARLKPYLLMNKFGLVLINSKQRGGAGGMANDGYPAWASITPCSTEDWEAVALHEICHGFNLADEYTHPATASASLGNEPNFALSTNAADVPWWGAKSEDLPNCIYDAAKQAEVIAGTRLRPPRDYVGLFAGARYSTRFFRPSLDCLMRDTATHFFCSICSAHILRTVTA